ncbi:WASH complex subunit 4 [Geodia barretti]|uniref:WASH complex subunit 4 n=1 Tax=Geodia barretti TaxID=519541 RepID=A0AA35R355_GEOBA|nr:WASH complex subunit 4 [Geodia barretti]
MATVGEEKGWTFDAFDSGTLQLAGKKERENYEEFIQQYTEQLAGIQAALDDTFGEAWDFSLDPIALQAGHFEHATLLELIRTDHKILNKVVTVFAALCLEIDEHARKAVTKYYLPLLLYGDGGTGEDGVLQDGEAQLMMGRMLQLLQDLTMFVNRISELVKSILQQLASLHSTQATLNVMNANGIHLTTVFHHIGKALAILVTLDHIFTVGDTFREHWNQYKRVLTSIKGAPTEYGMEPSRLKPFEKLLQNLEGKLMEGQLFRNCVTQIFDTREVSVTQNGTLAEEFATNIRLFFLTIDQKIGEPNESGQRQEVMALCCLLVLQHQIYNTYDTKLTKQVWDLHKKLPVIHVVGNLLWSHNVFMHQNLPYLKKVVERKQLQHPAESIKLYLSDRGPNLPRLAQMFYTQVSVWMIRMESDLTGSSSRDTSAKQLHKIEVNSRASLFIQGMLLSYNIGNLVRTTLNLHSEQGKPMTRSGVLAICKLIELLKCIQYTFHRQSMTVATYITHIVNHYELSLLLMLETSMRYIQDSQARGYSERALDILAGQTLMKTVLNGPGTKERRLVARLAYHFTLPQKDDERTPSLLRKLDAVCELRLRVQQMCDCSFLYWHKDVLVPLYLTDIYEHPTDSHRLHYMFTALRDCVPSIKWSRHQESPAVLLDLFDKEVSGHMKRCVLEPLCQDVEKDLRLSSHLHLQLDDRNPFKVGLHDLKHFMEVKPIRFFDRHIDIRAHVTHYLDTTFYNLTTVALHDWKTYGDMRSLAEEKYGLVMMEPHLPSATLEQGLDVLEIMRNIHVFVANYSYNLNNQIFVERQSNNKHLNTINIRHIANSIRTHGTGIMNTTVNFTYQFLRKKFFIFSQFMYDEYIKARLLKEIRFYKETRLQIEQRYPVERAEKFNKVIRKLGVSPDGLSYLDQFRILITQIGNAMGYIRMIRSGGLHCCSNAIRFVPDLEDIVEFGEMVQKADMPSEAVTASKIFDSVVGNLAKNFAEGTEYFKLLVDVFSPVFRNPKNRHLQNFYMVVPPLTLNYVEYMMVAKDRMNKKNKQGASFTDDGFSMGGGLHPEAGGPVPCI